MLVGLCEGLPLQIVSVRMLVLWPDRAQITCSNVAQLTRMICSREYTLAYSIEALNAAWSRLDAAARKLQSVKMSDVSEALRELELSRKSYADLQRLIPHQVKAPVADSGTVDVGTSFAERLLYWRSKSQLSRLELAKLSGVSLPQIARYETGKSAPRLGAVMKLADALAIKVENLTPKN